MSAQQFSVHIRSVGVGDKKHTSSHMALQIIKISECKLPTYSMKANGSAFYFFSFLLFYTFICKYGGGGYKNGRRYSCTD